MARCAQAEALLEEPDALERVAAALALVAGKVSIAQRSLLTGEDGMVTLLMAATDGSPLSPGDAMSAVSSLGSRTGEGGERPADHVGKIRTCNDPTKLVFDLPADMAEQVATAAAAASGEARPAAAGMRRNLLADGVLAQAHERCHRRQPQRAGRTFAVQRHLGTHVRRARLAGEKAGAASVLHPALAVFVGPSAV